MELSKQQLKKIPATAPVNIPAPAIFDFPERILQFGTGVLLRALPDYFVDKANKQDIFRGRIVVVKSTSVGGTDAFAQQDHLYTLTIRGIEDGRKVTENILNASISRVLSANGEWEEILACAANPALQIVLSNTTEVGIALTDDDIRALPPSSFPGKLLAFLYKRYGLFQGASSAGLVIVPTELITDNGHKLKEILQELSHRNKLEQPFIQWLTECNHFCNSLVDRIVPGKLPAKEKEMMEAQLGYEDDLMIMAEPYRLWAIESSSEEVKDILSFSRADEGMIITPDINLFRELKLRLLNGTHTFCCGLAFLAGFKTVKEAMEDEVLGGFIERIMLDEIATSITGPALTREQATTFAAKVLDRFRNPYIEHQWLSITVQYSSKMRMRNVPILEKYYEKHGKAPVCMPLAFAAYLLFMKVEKSSNGFTGHDANGASYAVQDESAAHLARYWQDSDPKEVVGKVLKDETLWGRDLSALPRFSASVTTYLEKIMEKGCRSVTEELYKGEQLL